MELSSHKIRKFLIFQDELPKPENQTRGYSLELLTYYCIHYFLAIFFSYRALNNALHHRYLTELWICFTS